MTTHSTFANLTISYGNLTIQGVMGDISYQVPNDMINVELDSRGAQTSASNVQGLQRIMAINISANSAEDKVLKAVMDAYNRPTAQNKNLIHLPLVILKAQSDGLVSHAFSSVIITSRKQQDDVLYSSNGTANQSRVLYTLSGVMPFFANEGVLIPY